MQKIHIPIGKRVHIAPKNKTVAATATPPTPPPSARTLRPQSQTPHEYRSKTTKPTTTMTKTNNHNSNHKVNLQMRDLQMKAFISECDRTGIPVMDTCIDVSASTVGLGSTTSLDPNATQALLHRLQRLCDNPRYKTQLDYEMNDQVPIHVFKFVPMTMNETDLKKHDVKHDLKQDSNKSLKHAGDTTTGAIGATSFLPAVKICIPVATILMTAPFVFTGTGSGTGKLGGTGGTGVPIESIIEHSSTAVAVATDVATTLSATTGTIFSINEGASHPLQHSDAVALLQLLKHRTQSSVYRLQISICNGFYYRVSFFSDGLFPDYVTTLPIRSHDILPQ